MAKNPKVYLGPSVLPSCRHRGTGGGVDHGVNDAAAGVGPTSYFFVLCEELVVSAHQKKAFNAILRRRVLREFVQNRMEAPLNPEMRKTRR